jgi:hypothetical protein
MGTYVAAEVELHHLLNSVLAANYQDADTPLARPTSRCNLFDGENILFDASLVIYIYIYTVLLFLQL